MNKKRPMQSALGGHGITLIEMMMVVAIAAILIAVAAPNLRSFYINNRLATATNTFMTALNTARSEAIRRGVTVTMRRTAAAQDCVAQTRDWTCGWEIFVDRNDDGACNACNTTPDGENTIQVALPLSITQPASARTMSLFSSAAIQRRFTDGRPNLIGGLAEFIQFTPDGRIPLRIDDGTDPLEQRATFVLCYYVNQLPVVREGSQSRSTAVLLNSGGRARLGGDANNNNVPENALGSDINNCTNPS